MSSRFPRRSIRSHERQKEGRFLNAIDIIVIGIIALCTLFGLYRGFIQSVLMGLSNPGAIFVIFALFAFFGIGPAENNDWRVAPIIVSVSVGSAVYWFLVTALLAHFRKKFKLRTIIWINRIAGAAIVVLGLALLGEGLFRVLFQGYPLI